ncbi:MAG: alanine--glyoxylate aminotransferase family protein [Planctomycetes bacterium]|nr:alanine--glyoxylate aminotransferase family protein [Planctomycetota bacterium]
MEPPTHTRLYIPGPVEVHPEVLAAMARPVMGHREKRFEVLYARVQEGLRRLLETRAPVYPLLASATGAMEMAIRNLVRRRVLCLSAGAFGERFHEVALANGKEAVLAAVEWGEPNTAEQVREALGGGGFDAVTVVHNETSTGVMSPLAEIARAVREHDDVLLLVDAVSSLGVVPTPLDAWGADLLLAGVQKGLGLPPGIALVAASERAHARARAVKDRGYYFDLAVHARYHERDQTPVTPSVSHLYALQVALDRIRREGLPARYARMESLAHRARAWGRERFALFAREGFESVSLTYYRNTRGVDVGALNAHLREHHRLIIGNGYGRLKDRTFRIAHMAETTLEDLDEVLSAIDGWLGV